MTSRPSRRPATPDPEPAGPMVRKPTRKAALAKVARKSGKYVRADALARADKAWSARLAGGTWTQAAEIAGYGSVEAAISGVKTIYGTVPPIERDDLRRLWRDRLEVAWRQVVRDMTDQRPGAITAAVRVAQAAAALDGLNEPARLDVTVTEGFEQIVGELVAHDL